MAPKAILATRAGSEVKFFFVLMFSTELCVSRANKFIDLRIESDTGPLVMALNTMSVKFSNTKSTAIME